MVRLVVQVYFSRLIFVFYLRISACRRSAWVRDRSLETDTDFRVDSTKLYNILAGGKDNVVANVYGGDIHKVRLLACLYLFKHYLFVDFYRSTLIEHYGQLMIFPTTDIQGKRKQLTLK